MWHQGSTVILQSYKNTFIRKENKNKDFIQQFFSISSRLSWRAAIVERVSQRMLMQITHEHAFLNSIQFLHSCSED